MIVNICNTLIDVRRSIAHAHNQGRTLRLNFD